MTMVLFVVLEKHKMLGKVANIELLIFDRVSNMVLEEK